MKSITLSELTTEIESVIRLNFDMPVWVRAEISELRESRGHCYLELIEKEESSDNLLAKTRATIWANSYRMLRPYFESTTGESLRAGLKVLVAVTVEYNSVYGFSLNIRDIDPVFTVGELAARRLEIIRQLEADGVAGMNKELTFPHLPQRLAIISSPTAAGYDDFCNQLDNNPFGYVFYRKLFTAAMQGSETEPSVINALERIYSNHELFDVVLIIRGGGATTDLAAFDSYNLALNCAQFPMPIIAGIGHQRDVSILDMVAHTSVKTPTAAAEFLIMKMREAEEELNNLIYGINEITSSAIVQEQRRMEMLKLRLRQAAKTGVLQEDNRLSKKLYRLKTAKSNLIFSARKQLELLEARIKTHSPEFLTERGYTITTLNGKRLNSKKQLKAGDKIESHFVDGSVESTIS